MFKKQRGVALVMGVVLMLVATVIGVTSMSQTTLQERAAGNQKSVVSTFMAAEHGLMIAKASLDNGEPPPASGLSNGVTWEVLVLSGDCNSASGCTLRSRATDGATNAVRVLEILYRKSGGALAPINIIGQIGSFDGGDSNAFRVTGAPGGPAIATNTSENVVEILGGIRADRIQNFVGGVREVEFDNPFGDPESLAQFIQEVKDSVTDENRGSISASGNVNNPSFSFNIGTPATAASEAIPKITIYNQQANGGRVLKMSGSNTGAGILIVEGDLIFQGTPGFQGLVIVTGTSFTVTGGGAGGVFGGSVVFANPINLGTADSPDWAFGAANASFEFDVTGGGTADFTYSEEALQMAQGLLNESAREMWVPVGGSSSGMSNWREVPPGS